MKIRGIIVSFIAISLAMLLAVPVFAHEAEDPHEESGEATSTIKEITFEDLGVARTGLLPTNPLYFIKEWERKIRIFFAGDPLKKAELELKFVNERAAELKKVVESDPNKKGLDRAIENYNEGVRRLEVRIEALEDNPNVDELLDRLRDRATQHQELFEELKNKNEAAHEKLEQAQNRVSEKLLKRGEDEVRPPPAPDLD